MGLRNDYYTKVTVVDPKNPSSPIELLQLWRHRQRLNQRAHYLMAEKCSRLAFSFGVASAIVSGAVGILILMAVRYDPPVWLRVTIGCLSILGAVVAATATLAKWSEKAAQHHAAGVAYGAILRRLEEALVLLPTSDEAMKLMLDELRKDIDAIPTKAPHVPKKVWQTLPAELTPSTGAEAQPGAARDEPQAARP